MAAVKSDNCILIEYGKGSGKKMEIVTCSFCGGKGKDPFGIMSEFSTCCVCGGRGVVQVEAPFTPCAHCNGSGAIKRLTCTVCGGTGFVPAPEGPTAACPKCGGTGHDIENWAMPCLRCHGRGWVPCNKVEKRVQVEF